MIVVYDTEYTAWEGSREARWSRPGEYREIVQIGAVRLDPARGFAEAGQLDLIVRPRRNPQLSRYFSELTGLTQERVDGEGIDFPAALARLVAFAGSGALFVANGHDERIVAENCHLTGIVDPLVGRTVNVSPILRRAAGVDWHICSCDLDRTFGLGLDLPAHDGLNDARAVAMALLHLHQAGYLDLAGLGGTAETRTTAAAGCR